jgi:hypothetical protein
MDELRESSLLFSLEGLMETERERVQREAREAQRRREEELIRVAEAGERRRVASLQERQARERRAAMESERERIEQERSEALRLATVERARLETESGLRLVEAERTRQHDLALAQIREAQGTARYRSLAWLSSGALLVAVASALLTYFGWIAPAHARSEQHLHSLLSESAERAKATEFALGVEQSKNRALGARVEQLEARLLAAQSAEQPISAVLKPVASGNPTSKRPPATGQRGPGCRDTGDPLDNCLR